MSIFDTSFDDAFDVDALAASGVDVIKHVEAGLDRLYMEFRKPNIIALTTTRLERWDMLEQVCQDLLLRRNIFTSVGFYQDEIGKIVGQPRNGLDNDSYRRYQFARIAVNNSVGTVETLIRIATLILNNSAARVVVTQPGTAATVVRIADVPTTDTLAAILIDLLGKAPLSGAKLVLEWSTQDPANVFTFDDGPGLDDGFLQGSAS